MIKRRLIFENQGEGKHYIVKNMDDQLLGLICKRRVGKFMHWCFVSAPTSNDEEMWFTNGCLKEITTFITKLYRRDKKDGD